MQFPERLPDGTLPAFAWPGGYPIVYLSEDGDEWCAKCASDPDAFPPILYAQLHEEGVPISCAGCGMEIESAYGDPDQEDEA